MKRNKYNKIYFIFLPKIIMTKRETLIWDIIEKNFNKYFPKLNLIKREKYIPSIWFMDFYWTIPWTNKVFIIELKTYSNNPNQQLIAYRWWLAKMLNMKEEDILLIWINEKLNKNNILTINNIEYHEFNSRTHEIKLKHKIVE